VYVGDLEDTHALITSGPVLSDFSPSILHSDNLRDLDGCWETRNLVDKESELPALRFNALRALKQLSRLAPKPGRILDFGCGGGFFLAEAAAQGWEAHGLEPLAGHATYARAKYHLDIKADVLGDDTFPPNFFDAITAFQVFEHLTQPVQTLSQLVRCLRPGGIILIEVPNIDTWSVKLLKNKHRHFVQDHLFFFSAKTLTNMASKCGLEPVEISHPTRRMTVRHLAGYLSRIIGTQTAAYVPFGQVIVPASLHDIVAILARKPIDN